MGDGSRYIRQWIFSGHGFRRWGREQLVRDIARSRRHQWRQALDLKVISGGAFSDHYRRIKGLVASAGEALGEFEAAGVWRNLEELTATGCSIPRQKTISEIGAASGGKYTACFISTAHLHTCGRDGALPRWPN